MQTSTELGLITRAHAPKARSAAHAPCHSTALTITTRRFTMSAKMPAGSVNRKNGAEAAVALRESESEEAPRSASQPGLGPRRPCPTTRSPAISHVERAVETVREDLQVSAQRIEAQTGPKLAAIFEAQEAMLGDPSLRDEIRDEIEGELISAAHALVRVFDRWQERFRQMPNEQLRERVLRLIRIVLEEVGQVPVSICGELAAELDAIPSLLRFGIRTLSVAPPLVPSVKEAIRQTSLQTT